MTQIVGLTGGIASGKSTVSRLLGQVGFPIIDADLVAHRLQQPGQPGFERLVERFGRSIVTMDGSLDRQRLGQCVFNNQDARNQLNQVMQPLIRETIMGQLTGFTKAAVPVVILDVPLLFEQGYDEDCDLVVVVTVDKATQLSRLVKRDGLSQAAAQARVAAQMPLNKKVARADIVIDNNGDDNHLRQQVAQLVKRLN